MAFFSCRLYRCHYFLVYCVRLYFILDAVCILPAGSIRTGHVAQWLDHPTVMRFSSRRIGSNPTVSHSKGLKQATHSTLFQSTQL